MKSARYLWLVVALALVTSGPASAESNWSWKKLVPSFGKKDAPAQGLYPRDNGPSMWRKMNNSTKRMMAKTKAAVPPWFMADTQDRVRKSSDSVKGSAGRVREEVRTAHRNVLAPWKSRDKNDEDEDKRPKTVSDFISQDRPE